MKMISVWKLLDIEGNAIEISLKPQKGSGRRDDQSQRYKPANVMVSLPKTYHEKPPLIKFRDTSDSIRGPRRGKMLIY